MDFQPWIGPLALLVALVGVYYQRRQTITMETQATQELDRAARRRGEVVKFQWWKTPAIPALAILVALAWAPYFVKKPSNTLLTEWGGAPGNCYELVNTDSLLQYADNYRVVGICGLTDPSTDIMEDERITISNAARTAKYPRLTPKYSDYVAAEPNNKRVALDNLTSKKCGSR